jgi:hypothetical protein
MRDDIPGVRCVFSKKKSSQQMKPQIIRLTHSCSFQSGTIGDADFEIQVFGYSLSVLEQLALNIIILEDVCFRTVLARLNVPGSRCLLLMLSYQFCLSLWHRS